MIAGVGPTQRQLPRKSAARVQYEDAAAAAAVDEYELEEGEEEGEQQEVTAITRPRVPALQLPGAASVTAARGDTATWASAREPSAAASPRRHAASSPPAVAAAAAANVNAGSISDNFGDTDGADPPLHLPRTEQLLLALKRYTGGPSSPGAAHGSQRSVCLSEQQSPLPSPRQAPGDGSSDYRGAYAAAGGVTTPPLSPRPMTSPSGPPGTDTGAKRGSQYGATVPPPGYPSMPPSATATNVVSRSLTPRQMQKALAAMAGAGGGGGADADAAALAPTRSAASFTAAVGGCHRPTLTQLFPEGGVGGQAGGAVTAGASLAAYPNRCRIRTSLLLSAASPNPLKLNPCAKALTCCRCGALAQAILMASVTLPCNAARATASAAQPCGGHRSAAAAWHCCPAAALLAA